MQIVGVEQPTSRHNTRNEVQSGNHALHSNKISPSPIPRPLFQAIHIARELAIALAGRPISFANSDYVLECLESLTDIRQTILETPGLDKNTETVKIFLQCIERVIQNTSKLTLNLLIDFVDYLDGYRQYRLALRYRWLPDNLLERESYNSIIMMLGPGIGVGDEIAFYQFFDQVQSRFPHAEVEIFSFFPGIWLTLVPHAKVRNLMGSPLRAFQRIEEAIKAPRSKKKLVIFGNFSGQSMLSAFAWIRHSIDFMEVALGRGELRLLRTQTGRAYICNCLDPYIPSQSRALLSLFRTVFHTHRHYTGLPTHAFSVSTRNRLQRDKATFRLFINPFTSKNSGLPPTFWAFCIQTVRRVVPVSQKLNCLIYPGLSKNCETYAEEIIRQCIDKRWVESGDRISLLKTPAGKPLKPPKAIFHTYNAISDADFCISIDTFTAHLVAHTDVPALNLCLSRNPEFWEEARNTMWINLGVGKEPVEHLIQCIVELITRDDIYAPLAMKFNFSDLGLPQKWELSPHRFNPAHFSTWLNAVDQVWNTLHPKVQKLLIQVDEGFAWTVIRQLLPPDHLSEENMKRIFDMFTTSIFFRLTNLYIPPHHSSS